jgi:hypothetical protein
VNKSALHLNEQSCPACYIQNLPGVISIARITNQGVVMTAQYNAREKKKRRVAKVRRQLERVRAAIGKAKTAKGER